MIPLPPGSVTSSIFGPGVVHFPNLESEIGGDGKRQRFGPSLTRFAVALGRKDAIYVPDMMAHETAKVLEINRRLGVTEANPDHVIAVATSHPDAAFSKLVMGEIQDGLLGRHALPATFNPRVLLPHIAVAESDHLARTLQVMVPAKADSARMANNKWLLKENLMSRGVSVPQGCVIQTPDDAVAQYELLQGIARRDPNEYTGEIWLKKARATQGKGVEPIADLDQLRARLADPYWSGCFGTNNVDDTVFLDVGIRTDDGIFSSPSVQINVGKEKKDDRVVFTTYQILITKPGEKRRTKHAGNFGPINRRDREQLMPMLDPIADWLRSIGACGICGIDFIKSVTGRFYVCEVNFRLTGCSAQGFTFRRLQKNPWARAWASLSRIRVDRRSYNTTDYMAAVSEAGLAYRQEEGGLFLVSTTPPQCGLNIIHGGIVAATKADALARIQRVDALSRELYELEDGHGVLDSDLAALGFASSRPGRKIGRRKATDSTELSL